MEYVPIQQSGYSFDLLRSYVREIKFPKNRTNYKRISTDRFYGSSPVANADLVFKDEESNTSKTMRWSISGDDVRKAIEALQVERDHVLIPSTMFEADIKKLIRCLCQVAYSSCNFSGYSKLASMKLKFL